jgi:hypothetical protein
MKNFDPYHKLYSSTEGTIEKNLKAFLKSKHSKSKLSK